MSLTGPFQFVVHELAADGGFFDFTLASGATNVESLNSIGNVTFTNLAAGTNVGDKWIDYPRRIHCQCDLCIADDRRNLSKSTAASVA